MATAPPPVPYAPWDPPSALIAPASPPLLPQFEFRTGLECQDEYSYSQLPTQWFGAQEASLLITALINAAVCTSCLALFLLLHWCSPSIRARIYQPLLLAKGAMPPTKSAAMPSSAAYPPRVWRRGLRWLLWPPRWSADCEYTLELCMMIRFLSMNFRLFSLLAPFAFCIILPVYGVDPPDIIKYDYLPPLSPEPRPPAPPPLSPGQPFLPPAPPAEPPDPSRFKTSWGGLEALSLTHLPPGSQRFYAPVVCMWFFTLLLLAMLNHEWPVFARLRHAWLEKPAPHTYAVLVRAQPASTSAAELQSRLAALFPGEVEAVMPLRRPTREMREYELTGMWTPRAPRATRAGQRLSTQRPGSPTRLRFGSHHQRGGSSGASLAAALRHAPRGGSTPSAASGASTAAIAVPGGGSARAGNVWTDAVTAVPREPYYLALVVDGGVPLLQPRPRPDRAGHARIGSFDASEKSGPRPGMPCVAPDMPETASHALSVAHKKEVLACSGNALPSISPVGLDRSGDLDGQGTEREGPITLQTTWSALIGSAPAEMMNLLRFLWSKEETVTAYTALFRTRRAASAVTQIPSLLGGNVLVRTSAAPQFLDAEWRSLLTPRRTRTAVAVLAWFVAVLLFLLWNVPVGLVQGLVRLDSISEVLAEIGLVELVEIVDSITGTRRATIEGWVASLVLTLMQMLTLYSGLLTFISRGFGFDSWAQVDERTLYLMFVFNFFLVLLASCIAGSLYATVADILKSGWCALIVILGRTLPDQSSFFLNYLLQDALLVTPLVDLVQILPLFLLGVQKLINACLYCCSCCVSCEKQEQDGRRKQRRLRGLPRFGQKLVYPYKYSRAMMVLNVGTMFACIAPLSVFFVLLWLLMVVPVWSYNLQYVWRPRAGFGFDTGGFFWPSVIRLQIFALQAAQVVLAGVVLINNRVAAFVLLLPLPIITGVVASSLRRKYFNLSRTLPLESAQAIDVDILRAAAAQDDGPPTNLVKNVSSGSVHDSDAGAALLEVPEMSKPPAVGNMLGQARGMYHGEAPPVPPGQRAGAPARSFVAEASAGLSVAPSAAPPRRARPPAAAKLEQLPLCDVARERSDGAELADITSVAASAAVVVQEPEQALEERRTSGRPMYI